MVAGQPATTTNERASVPDVKRNLKCETSVPRPKLLEASAQPNCSHRSCGDVHLHGSIPQNERSQKLLLPRANLKIRLDSGGLLAQIEQLQVGLGG